MGLKTSETSSKSEAAAIVFVDKAGNVATSSSANQNATSRLYKFVDWPLMCIIIHIIYYILYILYIIQYAVQSKGES